MKPPVDDDSLKPFDGGVGVLTRDGHVMGHVATTLSTFWSPFSPLRLQWRVWFIVAWRDGAREPSTEDYPPFLSVSEMKAGRLEVLSHNQSRAGRYDFAWLGSAQAAALLPRLRITPEDF